MLLSSFKINSLTHKKPDDHYHNTQPFHCWYCLAIYHPHRQRRDSRHHVVERICSRHTDSAHHKAKQHKAHHRRHHSQHHNRHHRHRQHGSCAPILQVEQHECWYKEYQTRCMHPKHDTHIRIFTWYFAQYSRIHCSRHD